MNIKEIEMERYFLMPTKDSLHLSEIDEEDFSPNFSTGLCWMARCLLKGAADVGAWSNSEHKRTVDVVCAGLKRMGGLCGETLYDILISMASPQLIRYPLFEGQGNFGCWRGESWQRHLAAPGCYTETRLSHLGSHIANSLIDELFPFPFPTLLVEGSKGYKDSIPPHNLSEVVDACLAMLDNPDITVDELMNFIQGPDFPAKDCEVVNSASNLKKIYETGKGRISIKNGNGKKSFFNVNMCALDDDNRYQPFNLREYLQDFIGESRTNIVKYVEAMLVRMSQPEATVTPNEIIAYEMMLASQSEADKLLRRQLVEIKNMFGDERRTKIKCRETQK